MAQVWELFRFRDGQLREDVLLARGVPFANGGRLLSALPGSPLRATCIWLKSSAHMGKDLHGGPVASEEAV